ncbi:MAG TPA: tetratricopeptide repeat protein [Pyrinomonadaceae bacterium]|nr:tetratricopeptide repeat protein [Pyrinomonadaceae bacterium]
MHERSDIQTGARAPRLDGPRASASARALAFALLLFFTCAAAPFQTTLAAQQGRPKIADDEDAPEKKKGAAPQPSARPSGHRPAADTRPAVRRPAAPAPLSVTFVTGLPETSIFLHRGSSVQLLGRTGQDGRLTAPLARGAHTVTASSVGRPMLRQQINVRPGSTTFSFDMTGKGATGVAVSHGLTAEQVFSRFLDPKQTDSLTPAHWQQAHAHASAALTASPLDPRLESQVLFIEGQLAHLGGDHARALTAFNVAALKTPSSALAFYGLGNAYLATNQISEAVRAYLHAVELNPGLALAHKGLGDAYAKQNKSKESLAAYERARGLGYYSVETALGAARAHLKQRRWSQALRELLEVARVKPSAEVFVGIGDSYVGLQQPLSAAPAYRKAIELDPNSAAAHYKFGLLAFETREYQSAAEALERALALDPQGTYVNRQRARDMANKAAARLRQSR